MFINNSSSSPFKSLLNFGLNEKKETNTPPNTPPIVKRQNTVGQTGFFTPILPEKKKIETLKRRSLEVKRKESDQDNLKEFTKPFQQEKQVETIKNKIKKVKEPKKEEVTDDITLSKSLKLELKGLLSKFSNPFKKGPSESSTVPRSSSPINFEAKQFPKNLSTLNLTESPKEIQVVNLEDLITYEEVDSPNRLKKPETKVDGEIIKEIKDVSKEIVHNHMMESFSKKKRAQSITTENISSPVDRNYTGYILNFMSIFSVPDIQEGFKEHLEKEENLEVLEFLIQVEKLQGCFSQEEQLKLLYEIIDTYLTPEKPKELNLEGKAKNELLKKLQGKDRNKWEFEETPYEFLKVLKNNILQDIKFDIWPRYISSDEGYDRILKHVNNPQVMSKNPSSAVLFKFQKNFGVSIDFPEAQKMADNLAYPQLLKQTYLDLSWVDNFIMDEDEDEETYEFEENIKIKIIIVGKKYFYKQGKFSFLHHLKNKEMEVFHTALMIGPLLFEWDENEVCLPKKSLAKEALMVTDLETTLPLKNLNENLTKLAETIVNWNVQKSFHLIQKNGIFGNSQDFVDSLLESIGIKDINVPYAIHSFLSQIREKGNGELEFKPSTEFQRKFKVKKISQFSSHQELDEFTQRLLEIDVQLPKNHPDEFTLLKSFDRGFWMKHVLAKKQIQKNSQKIIDLQKEKFIKAVKGMHIDVENITKEIKQFEKDQKMFIQESLKFEPCFSKQESSCPFCDPRRTNSFFYQ